MSEEVARFEALGDKWWDSEGPMAPLHRVNPVRIGWARDLIVRHFKLETGVGAPLAGVDFSFHMRGDVADALNVGDRRAAEFHHQTRHSSLGLGGDAQTRAMRGGGL